MLPLLKCSRTQESDSDTEALAALAAVYGHVGGASDAFGEKGARLNFSVSCVPIPLRPNWKN
jgi:hypothetical protein